MSPRLGDGKGRTRPHWSPKGHGIETKLGNVSAADTALATLLVEAEGSGTFPTVAEAFGSLCLPPGQEIAIGQLWAALPELGDFPLVVVERPVLRLTGIDRYAGGDRVGLVSLYGVPEWIVRSANEDRPALVNFLAGYPRLAGWDPTYVGTGTATSPEHVDATIDGGIGRIRLSWPLPRTADDDSRGRLRENLSVRYRSGSYVLPGFGSPPVDVHPLVVWWAILHALSMLVRYEPRTWAQIIDVDQSPHAVAVEHLLEQAMTAIPEVTYEAIQLAEAL